MLNVFQELCCQIPRTFVWECIWHSIADYCIDIILLGLFTSYDLYHIYVYFLGEDYDG